MKRYVYESIVDAFADSVELCTSMRLVGTTESSNYQAQADNLCDALRDVLVGMLESDVLEFTPCIGETDNRVTTVPLQVLTSERG